MDTPILAKDFFFFCSVLEVFTKKHSFNDDLVLFVNRTSFGQLAKNVSWDGLLMNA